MPLPSDSIFLKDTTLKVPRSIGETNSLNNIASVDLSSIRSTTNIINKMNIYNDSKYNDDQDITPIMLYGWQSIGGLF